MGQDITTSKPPPRLESVPAASSVRKVKGATSASVRLPAKPRYALIFTVLLLTTGLAVTWTLIAQRELRASTVASRVQSLDAVKTAFEASRTKTHATLQAFAQILVEDPRLKATLATENMNAATVDDILADLTKLRGGGFFMVLTPEARVFAEAGAKELRGMDLSTSSIVKKAQTQPTAAVGSWVLGGKVMDLSIQAVLYGENVIAFLVVGQANMDADAHALADQCACEVATVLGTNVDTSSTTDATLKAVFAAVSSESAVRGRIVNAGGTDYVVSSFELTGVNQSHRLIAASAMTAVSGPFSRISLLVWLPPVLVLLTALFALSANRSPRRSS